MSAAPTNPSMRRRCVLELSTLAVLTVLFLVAFPERPMAVDLALAGFAAATIFGNLRFTRERIWAAFPPQGDEATRRSAAWRIVGSVTIAALLVFLLVSAFEGRRQGGIEGVLQRLRPSRFLLAALVYVGWALLQQFLFQVYLLGRLLHIAPRSVAITLTGLLYSLVHLPDLPTTAVTAIAGVFWTACYWRTRQLLPLALSHALLGSAFYIWVQQRELFQALPGL